jgi:hypothetical protein
MLNESVWEAATMGSGASFLCIGCVENRRGRMLQATDFSGVPINAPSLADTPRLALRKVLHLWRPPCRAVGALIDDTMDEVVL